MRSHFPSRRRGYFFLAMLIALWWVGTAAQAIPASIPSPHDVFWAAVGNTRTLIDAVLVSLQRTLPAFVGGSMAGLALGACHGLSPAARRTTGMFIDGLRPLPSIALIPLAILLFGTGDMLNMAIAAFACTWPTFISACDGVRGVSPLLVDSALTIGTTRRAMLWEIILPAALPTALTGLRIGLGIAFAVEVSVEMIVPRSGIGAMAATAALSGQNALLYAAIAAAAITGLSVNQAFGWAESRILRRYGPQWSNAA
jgi:NitT/TauT family transport system permease protein